MHSLSILSRITNAKGAIALTGVYVEISEKHCRIAVKRKYQFAYFWNCSIRDFGRNVMTLYFDVLMKLDGNLECLLATM